MRQPFDSWQVDLKDLAVAPVNGKSLTSAFTVASEDVRPISRFTSKIVLTGFEDAWQRNVGTNR